MCHKTLDYIKIYSENWKRLNPEYNIILYDDELCKKFLLEEFSQLHLDIFNFLQHGPIKADFWRLCILYKYGGLYVDADIEPLVPLKEYIDDDDEFVTCISFNFSIKRIKTLSLLNSITNNIIKKYLYTNTNFNLFEQDQLNPHFILANKNNKILENCINTYISYYNKRNPYMYWSYSLVHIMYIKEIKEKKSQILYIDNKKYKFLVESHLFNEQTLSKRCSKYNDKIVFKNKYNTYKNHNFIK